MLDIPVEQCLIVGNRVVVNVNLGGANIFRMRSRIRGWSTGESIMLGRTLTKDQSARMRPDSNCVVEFVHDRHAFGMLTSILDLRAGRNYFSVGWPKKAERAWKRNSEILALEGSACSWIRLWRRKPNSGYHSTFRAVTAYPTWPRLFAT